MSDSNRVHLLDRFQRDLIFRAESQGIDPRDLADDGSIRPYVAPSFDLPDPIYSDIADPNSTVALLGDPPPPLPPTDAEDEESEKAGWCPSGSWSGGICKPYNNPRDNWMARLGDIILRVQDMIIPGTHNAGADKQAPETSSNMTCQDVSPYAQLHAGIRAFDLRIHFYSGYGVNDPRRFQIVHKFSTGRTFQGDILNALTRFRSDNGGRGKDEIVILDIHSPENFTDAVRQEFINVVRNWGASLLAPHYLKDLTAPQWMALGKNTLVALDGHADPKFWPAVKQCWIGKNVTSSDELDAFANQVVAEIKPEYQLRALQYHKHVKITYVPDDISDRVMNRSASGTATSPIQGLYIFNTDWSLRHRMVDNCIQGNWIRSGGITRRMSPSQGGTIIRSGYPVIYQCYDGNHAPEISIEDGLHIGAVVYMHNASWGTNIVVSNVKNLGGLSILRVEKGDRFSLRMKVTGWEVVGPLHTSKSLPVYTIPTPEVGELITLFQTLNGEYSADIQLPATAPSRAIIIVMCNSSYGTTINGQRLTNSQSVYLASRQQCAVQYAGSGMWNLIGGPV